MQITLKLFATLSDHLPPGTRNNRLDLEIDESDTVLGILQRQQLPERLIHLVLVNGVYIPPQDRGHPAPEPRGPTGCVAAHRGWLTSWPTSTTPTRSWNVRWAPPRREFAHGLRNAFPDGLDRWPTPL